MSLLDDLGMLFDAPGALLGAGRWLCGRLAGPPSRVELRGLIGEHFAGLPATVNRGEFPRVSTVQWDGRRYYLRLYWLRHLLTAARYLWAAQAAGRMGLPAPAVRQRCFTRVGGRFCLALLEEELPGRPVEEWTPALAGELAGGIATWHSIERCPAFMHYGRHSRTPRRRYTALCRNMPRHGRSFTKAQQGAIQTVLSWLTDRRFVGPVALSHGDLHPHNLLLVDENRIGWLDLDAIRFRPARHDLAAAEFDLLRNFPEAVDAFENTYFDEDPGGQREWGCHRLKWFALYSVLKGVKFLVGTPRLPGQKDRSEQDRARRAEVHFARAAAALDVHDEGESSGALIRKVLRSAGARTGSAEGGNG